MNTPAEHVSQAEHNEAFFQFVSASAFSADGWRVTLLFYAALPYADAYLHQLQPPVSVHPTGHRQRLLNVETYLGPSLADNYRDLKDRSEAARYDGATFTNANLQHLHANEFTRIRTHVRTALRLPE